MTKTKILTLLLSFISMVGSTFAQDRPAYNIYGQIYGTCNGIGIGFDSRFKPGGIFGYSAGISFVDLSYDDSYDGGYDSRSLDCTGVSIPLEINAIMGKRASKFEVGIGLVAYLVDRNETYINYDYVSDGLGYWIGYEKDRVCKSGFRPNIAGSLSIGYRLQRKSGFFMKLGLSVLVGGFSCSPFDGVIAFPNICLGYTLPHF